MKRLDFVQWVCLAVSVALIGVCLLAGLYKQAGTYASCFVLGIAIAKGKSLL
jgi:hypothetical protein